MSKLSIMSAAAAVVATSALSALPAHAQTTPQPMGSGEAAPTRAVLEASFKQADKDSDTRLSKAEIGAMKGWNEKLATADTDKDGFISMTEFLAAHGTK